MLVLLDTRRILFLKLRRPILSTGARPPPLPQHLFLHAFSSLPICTDRARRIFSFCCVCRVCLRVSVYSALCEHHLHGPFVSGSVHSLLFEHTLIAVLQAIHENDTRTGPGFLLRSRLLVWLRCAALTQIHKRWPAVCTPRPKRQPSSSTTNIQRRPLALDALVLTTSPAILLLLLNHRASLPAAVLKHTCGLR